MEKIIWLKNLFPGKVQTTTLSIIAAEASIIKQTQVQFTIVQKLARSTGGPSQCGSGKIKAFK